MGIGYLKVEMRMGEGALPVAGQQVNISDMDGQMLYTLISGEDGNSETVELESPDRELSLDPDYAGWVFATYNIMVPSDGGFCEVSVHGVHVFDGELSIVQINMAPYMEGLESLEIFVPEERPINASYEDLQSAATNERLNSRMLFSNGGITPYGGMYRGGSVSSSSSVDTGTSEIAPIPANEIIIPQHITVHLGSPGSAAANVRMPFIDYVKNVASSEIYPTWPQESLKANILAQITFALNRIFTVWYRSRGYDFDITSSPAFDQSFVHGREIYQSISTVVDEIFNQFIRRIGRLEPYFAQSCNGTTVTSDGLSQWGSVGLAQNGLCAHEILLTYFPSDIRIFQSDNIATWEGTYPGMSMSEGMNGDDVMMMQIMLNRIRTNYPLIPPISNPNGVFDAATAAAVREFQRMFNLISDGVIGKATWYTIVRIFIVVTKLADLDNEGSHIIGVTPPNVVLRQGARGEAVLELQFLLNFIAQFYPSIPFVNRNGTFDAATTAAVKAFQTEFGVTADGVVGQLTWNLLYEVFRSLRGQGQEFPGTPLRIGARGEDVRLVQEYLNEIAIFYPSIPRLTVDGIFGRHTEQSVKAFQALVGLEADGIIDNNTWNAIVDVYNGLSSMIMPVEFPGTSLQKGSRGDDVRLMQEYLNNIAQYYRTIPTISVDGVFGNHTEQAVRTFQEIFGLDADGKIGRDTWNAIVDVYNGLGTIMPREQESSGTILREGSRGEEVRMMQEHLNAIAEYYPSIPMINADGIFGSQTAQAVRAFQTLFGLDVDGIIGPDTRNAIEDLYNALDTIVGRGHADIINISPAYPGTPITWGSKGDETLLMQEYLNTIAAFYPTIPLNSANGIFGEQTEEATRTFQQMFGLIADGIIDRDTWNAIIEVYESLRATVASQEYPGEVLDSGSEGNSVYTIQEYLNSINQVYHTIPMSRTDGVFDENTLGSVQSFQRVFGLNADGRVGPITWNTIVDVYNLLA